MRKCKKVDVTLDWLHAYNIEWGSAARFYGSANIIHHTLRDTMLDIVVKRKEQSKKYSAWLSPISRVKLVCRGLGVVIHVYLCR